MAQSEMQPARLGEMLRGGLSPQSRSIALFVRVSRIAR